MAVGLNADSDWLQRATNLGAVGHATWTAAGWFSRPSAGQTYSTVSDGALIGLSHSSNGRALGLRWDNNFGSGTINDPRLCLASHITSSPFASNPAFDAWYFFYIRSGAALGTVNAEFSLLGTETWVSHSFTNDVEDSVQGEVFHIGRLFVGETQTAYGNYAYWHAYNSDIGQAAARALKYASTPQNSPWAFWPLDDNTDTADDSGNARTLTFNGTITSETSPVLGGGGGDRQFFLIRP